MTITRRRRLANEALHFSASRKILRDHGSPIRMHLFYIIKLYTNSHAGDAQIASVFLYIRHDRGHSKSPHNALGGADMFRTDC